MLIDYLEVKCHFWWWLQIAIDWLSMCFCVDEMLLYILLELCIDRYYITQRVQSTFLQDLLIDSTLNWPKFSTVFMVKSQHCVNVYSTVTNKMLNNSYEFQHFLNIETLTLFQQIAHWEHNTLFDYFMLHFIITFQYSTIWVHDYITSFSLFFFQVTIMQYHYNPGHSKRFWVYQIWREEWTKIMFRTQFYCYQLFLANFAYDHKIYQKSGGLVTILFSTPSVFLCKHCCKSLIYCHSATSKVASQLDHTNSVANHNQNDRNTESIQTVPIRGRAVVECKLVSNRSRHFNTE